ncbi:hypothetical protein BGZ81_007235 [Podila clonocystis]|nr:hypothetical protein BGZ81_007235 [Podila clonocystis]
MEQPEDVNTARSPSSPLSPSNPSDPDHGPEAGSLRGPAHVQASETNGTNSSSSTNQPLDHHLDHRFERIEHIGHIEKRTKENIDPDYHFSYYPYPQPDSIDTSDIEMENSSINNSADHIQPTNERDHREQQHYHHQMHYTAHPTSNPSLLTQEQNEDLHQKNQQQGISHSDNFYGGAYNGSSPPQQQQTSVLPGQPLAILHPALSTTPVPSTVAPSIYALASTVPFPTISQLSMKIHSNPGPVEKVAVPFKTILHAPSTVTPAMHDTQPSSETTVATETMSRTVNPSPDSQIGSVHLLPIEKEAAGEAIDAYLPHPTRAAMDKPTDVHPYFAAAQFPPLRPSSAQINSTTVVTEPLGITPSTSMTEAEAWATVSPPCSTANYIQDPSCPGYVGSVCDGRSSSEIPNDGSAGTRTAVFGFAPLFDQRDQAALGEESVLDGSQTMPPKEGPSLDNSEASGDNSNKDHDRLDPNHPRVTFSVPHVRAGIAPTLDLDPLKPYESRTNSKEQSVESLVESKDWSTTGLGPRESWDPELSMLMPMLMRSAAPLAIYWGDQYYLIYNDWDTLRYERFSASPFLTPLCSIEME